MSEQRECKGVALRLLAIREHSRYELAQKLRRRCACDAESLAQLLDKLQEVGYLNDLRYAEAFSRSAIARGRGPQRIAFELSEHGVAKAIISQVLAAVDTDWCVLASEQRAKKFGREIPTEYKERARQSRFLAARGFYTDTIKAVFQRLPYE
jgi:regulatory protein